MAVSYAKLSEGKEKNLETIINDESTYVAAFKSGEANYKIPIGDFKIPESTGSNVYTLTVKRTNSNSAYLKVYDEGGSEISGSEAIDFLDGLVEHGYTIVAKVTDDYTLPIFDNYNEPVYTFRLVCIDTYGRAQKHRYTFEYIDTNDLHGNAIYVLELKVGDSVEFFANITYHNLYSRNPESAVTGIDSGTLKFFKLSNNGRYGLPHNADGKDVDIASFGAFEWDANNNSDNHLILNPPTSEQVHLRSEFLIRLTHGTNLDNFLHAAHDTPAWSTFPEPNKIVLPSVNDGVERFVEIYTNKDSCSESSDDLLDDNYCIFKITAVGYGWEFTPLVNCGIWQDAYPGVLALYQLRVGD